MRLVYACECACARVCACVRAARACTCVCPDWLNEFYGFYMAAVQSISSVGVTLASMRVVKKPKQSKLVLYKPLRSASVLKVSVTVAAYQSSHLTQLAWAALHAWINGFMQV